MTEQRREAKVSRRQDRPSSELEALHTISGALYHQFGAYQAVEAALAAPTLRAVDAVDIGRYFPASSDVQDQP